MSQKPQRGKSPAGRKSAPVRAAKTGLSRSGPRGPSPFWPTRPRLKAPEALNALFAWASHVIISVPPGEGGDPVLAALRPDTLSGQWIGYLSTTGVYGDRQGRMGF